MCICQTQDQIQSLMIDGATSGEIDGFEISSSMFALYSAPPPPPSNSNFGYAEEGETESTAGYTFTPVGSFACPGIDTQVQGVSVLHHIQRTRQSK
jgi:hypothetical protein